jgi:hypothetical protein
MREWVGRKSLNNRPLILSLSKDEGGTGKAPALQSMRDWP